jgi:hypothetical protein
MGDRDDKKKLQGGLNFTKAMPNFMAKMAGGTSGSAPDLGGIEGAMQRHAARAEEEREEREDNEDEAPIVVDAAEALTAKERKKLEAKQPGAKLGGSLRFKEGDTSAAAKFMESAYERVQAEEQKKAELAEAADAAAAEAAAKAGKAVLFAGSQKPKNKRKSDDGQPRAKAIKNAKLLSFAEDDEE